MATHTNGIRRRDFLRVAGLGLAAPLLIQACGSGPESSSASPPAKKGPGPGHYRLDLGGYDGPELGSKQLTLRIMRQAYNPTTDQLFSSLYAEFSKAYPNITISEEIVPYGNLNQKLQTYVASGDVPDIMMGNDSNIQAYLFSDIALPLSDYLTSAYVDDILPSLRQQSVVDGKLYGMPWDTQMMLLYFNRDMFAQAGVATPPETPDLTKGWTWQQAGDAWDRITSNLRKGGNQSTYAIAASGYGNGGPGSNYQYEGIYIRGLGDPKASSSSTAHKTFAAISSDGFTASGYVDTPEAIQGMKFYQQQFTKGWTPKVAVANQFENGQAATKIQSITGAVKYSSNNPHLAFNWGVAAVPRGKIFFNHNFSDCPIVWAKTPHAAESVALLAFLCNDKNRLSFAQSWGTMPARTSLIAKLPEYSKYPQTLAATSAKAGYGAPSTPGYLEYLNAMNGATKDIALGADPASRLHSAGKEIDGLLRKYRR